MIIVGNALLIHLFHYYSQFSTTFCLISTLQYCTTRNQTVDLYDSSNSNIPQIYPGQKLPPTSPEVWQRAEKYMALTQEEYDKYLHLLDTAAHFFYVRIWYGNSLYIVIATILN